LLSRNEVIKASLKLISKRDRRLLIFVVTVQILLGLVDLVAVALIGVIASLAIRGVSATAPGNKVSEVLRILHIQDMSIQQQATILGLTAAVLMIGKTLASIIFIRKSLFFISRRSAIASAALLSKVLSQDLLQVQSRSFQTTLYGVTSGIDTLAMGVIGTLVMMISDISLSVILIFGLFMIDTFVAMSTLVFFLTVALLLHKSLSVRTQKITRKFTNLSIDNNQRILEVLGAYREIFVKNRRQYYVESIGSARMQLAELSAERTFMPNISKYVFELTTVIGAFGIAAIQFVANDAARAVTILTVFLAASARISPALLRIQQGVIALKGNAVAAEPTLKLLNDLEGLPERSFENVEEIRNYHHSDFKGEVILNEIHFRYPLSSVEALSDVSLRITSGEIIAIVGPSGAGKSTLVDLMLGLIPPSYGQITVNGYPPIVGLREFPGAIAYVPQDCLIFEGTLRENILLGFPSNEFTDEEVWASLRIASLEDFVRYSPKGLDLLVGERGTKLSGGQRQRLGIARAMITKPKLIILDEATSALDGQTELSISESIQTLKGNCTVVLIAHRLSTVRNADKVVYLDKGKVLSVGTFNEVRLQIADFDKQAKLMGL
jgi:ABC-type multidrug transport system fused ATPase/permease subunit